MPSGPQDLRHEFVYANGLRFHVAAAGEGDKLALCLHGFPELWYSWRHQIPLLASLGYKVWAPDLRGYGQTDKPDRMQDYAVETLMDDVAGLIDAANPSSTLLIAHDWGGIIATWFATHQIRPIDRFVLMNIPHPAAARKHVGWRQRLRSWYTLFFQIPGVPERMLRKRIGNMFEQTSSPGSFGAEDQAVYADNVAQPGVPKAMIDYYRALVRGGGFQRMNARGYPPIEVPSLMIWGTDDIALGVELTLATKQYIPDLTLRYLPGIGHWVQQEAPDQVNAMLEAWLTGKEVPQAPGAEAFEKTLAARTS